MNQKEKGKEVNTDLAAHMRGIGVYTVKDFHERFCSGPVHLLNAQDKAATPQPPPEGMGEVVLGYVQSDLAARAAAGEKKYGTMLRTHNGREALWDAYQEALDLAMYLRQAILEEEDRRNRQG